MRMSRFSEKIKGYMLHTWNWDAMDHPAGDMNLSQLSKRDLGMVADLDLGCKWNLKHDIFEINRKGQ